MLRCKSCRAVYRGRFCRDNSKLFFYYHCQKYCGNKTLRCDKLDAIVWKAIEDALLDPKKLKARIKAAAIEATNEATKAEPQPQQSTQDDILSQRNVLFQQFNNGLLTIEQLTSKLRDITSSQP